MASNGQAEFQRATPVLKSGDYPRSREFYVERLGFRSVEEGGEPPRFGIFERGRAVIFVTAWHGAPNPIPGVWEAYFHIDGLDALSAEFGAAGATITRPIELTVYGMREFEVTDPDGNVLCFGEDAGPSATS